MEACPFCLRRHARKHIDCPTGQLQIKVVDYLRTFPDWYTVPALAAAMGISPDGLWRVLRSLKRYRVVEVRRNRKNHLLYRRQDEHRG